MRLTLCVFIMLAIAASGISAQTDGASRIQAKPENLTTNIAGGASGLSTDTRSQILRVEELRSDISALHLINGLRLAREQTQALLGKCREAKKIRTAAIEEMQPLLKTAEVKFKTLKQDLLKDEVHAPTLDDAYEANFALKRLKEEYDKKISALEAETNKLFTEEQQEVIRQYRPCVVPTKEEREQSRVGQAVEPAAFARILDYLRQVSPDHLEEARKRALEMHFVRWEKHFGVMTDNEKEEVRKVLETVVAESRKMTQTQFEMKKLELAQRVEMPHSQKTRPRLNEPGKTANLLLDDRVIPMLEAKLNAHAK